MSTATTVPAAVDEPTGCCGTCRCGSGATVPDAVPAAVTAWVRVCRLEDLVPERGAAALVAGEQVALFRLADDRVLAVQHRDPFSGANVLARGIVGSRGEAAVLTSPMLKQVWDLATGACLDPVGREPQDLRTAAVRVEDGDVLVATAPAGLPDATAA